MVYIDREACIGCGLCAKDCVAGVLSLSGGKAQPVSDGCMDCGHCVAICPRGAAHLDVEDEILPYRKDAFSVDPDNFLRLIRFRRSCRCFTGESLSEKELSHLLEAGRYTPTGSNRQTTRYILVTEEKESLRKLVWTSLLTYGEKNGLPKFVAKAQEFLSGAAQDDKLYFGAPHVLFVVSESLTDGCLAACSIELMAAAMGLGAMYSGYTVRGCGDPSVRAFLGLKPQEQVCAVLTLGRPVRSYRRTAPRKPLDLTRK